jgi:hypothetical protein
MKRLLDTSGGVLFSYGPTVPRRPRPPHFSRFRDHTHLRHTTVGRTPLVEWPARRRDLYLTTHNTHKRQTSVPPVGFEPTIPASERLQTHSLDRAAIGISSDGVRVVKYMSCVGMCGSYNKYIKNFVLGVAWKVATWNTNIRQKDNIKRELKETGCLSMNKIELAEDCTKSGLLYHGQRPIRGLWFLMFFPQSFQKMLNNMKLWNAQFLIHLSPIQQHFTSSVTAVSYNQPSISFP